MKNSMLDLHNHLFIAIERLNDESLTDEQVQQEISRAKAISDVSGKIIDLARTSLESEKLKAEYGSKLISAPPLFTLPPTA